MRLASPQPSMKNLADISKPMITSNEQKDQ